MFDNWCDSVDSIAVSCLNTCILAKRDKQDVFEVNFRPELSRIIKEAKSLDQLGLKTPEIALNVALQVSLI
jgi:hypothetical protein